MRGPLPRAAGHRTYAARRVARFVPLSYSTREPGIQLEADDPKLDVGFTPRYVSKT